MIARLWDVLGLHGDAAPRLQINSLGEREERLAHRDALIAYFESHASRLDADAQRRLHTNPLRILDSKNPAMADLIARAPLLSDFLGDRSRAHLDAVRTVLEAHGIAYTVNPRLVRGLDYYNLTVFEWITDKLGAQGTVCGGGRYDSLVEQMGGKPAPACGFAIGIERLVELLHEVAPPSLPSVLDVYLVHWGEGSLADALRVAEACRAEGLVVQMHCGDGSLKSQMKKADQSGAAYAVLMGDDERGQAKVAVKALRGDGVAPQELISYQDLPVYLKAKCYA